MLRKSLLLNLRCTISRLDMMRYLSVQCVPSLFRALHSDVDFVASICASEFSSTFLMKYLAIVPSSCVSMRALLCVVNRFDYIILFSPLVHISRLEELSMVIDRSKPDHVVLASAELDILKLIVEEFLARLGMYASSLPVDEYDGGRFVATAHRIFMAIPSDVVLGQHLTITGNAYSAGSYEWCCMMRKVASILSNTQNFCETCLYQAWLEQWDRYTNL